MRYEDIIPFYQKLNYKCPKDKYGEGFSCGKTKEEARKNFETEQKLKAEKQKGVDERRGKRAEKVSSKAEKRIAKITDPVLLENVKNVRSLIDKAKSELASGKVSKQTYKELRNAVNTLRGNNTAKTKQEMPLKEKSLLSSKDQNKSISLKESNEYITKEEATKLYSQTMKDLSDYVSKTSDYSSDQYKQLTKNKDKAIQIYNDLRTGKQVRKSEMPNVSNETEIASKILKTQIEHAKDASSFLGKEAILQLRKQGLDSKGNPLSNLSKSEADKLLTNTPKIISELRSNKTVKNLKNELTEYKEYLSEGMTEIEGFEGTISVPTKIEQINEQLSNQTKEFKDIFDLYHKENFLYTDKTTFIPGTNIKKDFNTNVYIDKNNNTYSISYEPGMEEKAKEVAFIIGTLPEKLRNINNIMLTNERNPQDETWSKSYGMDFHSAATCSSANKVVVAWEGSEESTDINTLYHEFAHSLDSKRTTNEIASSPEYISAFSKDGEKFTTEYASSAGKLFSKTNRKLGEDFAESVAAYYKNEDKFQKQFPNKHAFISELFGGNK